MLTLVEPIINGLLVDRPHLGCAMLISSCLEKGIKTTLIKGQTRYLKDMFINDSEELWGLIRDLKEDDLKRIEIGEYKKFIQEKGLKQFQDELKSLYEYVIIDKNPRHYFNALLVEKFSNLHSIFVRVYYYYLTRLNHGKLKIIDRYISEIIKSNPRYIGFSLEKSFEPFSRAILRRIKGLTGIPVIVGGTLTPFIDLKELDKIFGKEYFDYLVIGAGENVLPSLIKALANKKEPRGIKNVFYQKNGKIEGNSLEVINDLDSLPDPDYSQFDLDLYLTPQRILPLQTARGCSWKRCTFCTHHKIYMGNYRTFSIDKLIKTIEHLRNSYDCSHFVFHDEELPSGRAKKISEAVLNNDLNGLSIYAYARLTRGYNSNKVLSRLSKAGFSTIAWGMESGSQRVLNSMDKGIKVSEMSQILKKSSKNRIVNLCFIIFGFPGETKDEAQETVDFLKKHADYIEDIVFCKFNLDPCSPIGKNPEKWGVDIKEKGVYSTKTGMSFKASGVFFAKFNAGFSINSIKVTSDKLKFILHGNNRRMLHFLNSSHRLLPGTSLLKYLDKGQVSSIFPIILGEIKSESNRNIFCPINIKETYLINRYLPEKERVLNGLEKKIFVLSDGRLSIEEIISAIHNDSKRKYAKAYLYKKCIDFFRGVFSKNLGLAFAKSWGSSRESNIKIRSREPAKLFVDK